MKALVQTAVLAMACLRAAGAEGAAIRPLECDLVARAPPSSNARPPIAPASSLAPSVAPAPTAASPAVTQQRYGFVARMSLGPPVPVTVGGWALDNAVRAGLRARTRRGQLAAAKASDMLVWSLILTPFLTGALQVGLQGGDLVAITEVELVGVEAYATSMLIAWMLHLVVGRERPFAVADRLDVRCKSPSTWFTPGCHSDRNASFLSGHSASAFTAAGLVCAQTLYLADPHTDWNDVLCGLVTATAATTAMLRVVADRHYATDILAGFTLGLTAGFFVPMLLNFSPSAPLPVALSVPATHTPHDVGLMLASAAAGFIGGGIVPLVTTAFRGPDTARSALRVADSLAVVPLVLPENRGGGLAIVGAL